MRACAVRSEGRALQRVIGCLEGRAADGRVEIDLDGRDGARVGYRCLPFLRGSRRCAALSRWSAVQRARAALDLPPGARLTRAALADRGEGGCGGCAGRWRATTGWGWWLLRSTPGRAGCASSSRRAAPSRRRPGWASPRRTRSGPWPWWSGCRSARTPASAPRSAAWRGRAGVAGGGPGRGRLVAAGYGRRARARPAGAAGAARCPLAGPRRPPGAARAGAAAKLIHSRREGP